jgi:FHS family glucose/mannose:H+ symporter-like MFS transporter
MYYRNPVFASACAGMLLFGVSIVSLGTVNTFLAARFSLDQIALGSLAALLPFGILAGSLIFGPVVDRYGYRVPLIVSSLLILAGFETIAFTGSFPAIQFAFFLIGLGGGVINGGTNALVADITIEGKGASLSLLGVFFGIGALGMPALTGLLLTFASSETIVALIGFGVLIPVCMFALVAFPSPKQAQGFPLKKGLSMLKHPALLLLSFALFFQSGMEGMANNWGTMYLQRAMNMTIEASLFGLTLLAASLTIARVLLGFLLKKFRPATIMLACIALTFGGGLALAFARAPWMALIGMALMGLGFAPVFPVILGFVAELFADLSGTAFGIALVIALTGNTLLNYLVGALTGRGGIGIYPWVHMTAAVALTILVLSARRNLPSSTNA